MAKGKKISAKQLKEEIEGINAVHDLNIKNLEIEYNKLSNIFDLRQKQLIDQEIINQKKQKEANIDIILVKHKEKQNQISKYLLDKYSKQSDLQKEILYTEEKRLQLNQSLLQTVSDTGRILKNGAVSMKKYLMESDAAIKSVTLELGLSGERASILRENFEQSAGFAARLGVDMAGLAEMTSKYAEETGRVRMHNEANLKSMTLIAKGTNLGIQGAAEMAAQYEMMGFNATDTASEVQRIVDTTERMGVNTSKVLKAVNKNFKTLQKYNFRGGVKGMADMAIYAEKFKISMEDVFKPMEQGRRLDSVIQMSAELQVLGGQFANLADPMSMLFESRNDPEAYMKRINEMTKGMVTMNKTADGFNLEIASPMAQDQLAQAAKALGMTTDELTTQAFRMREIQQTRSQMFSKGFTKDEKDIIEGLAKFDKNTGRMMVEVGGVATDVSRLNSNQIKGLKQEKASLEARAEASQTFDQAFNNTIMELKSALLPVLNTVNDVLKAIRPTVKKMTTFFSESSGWMKAALVVAGAFTLSATKMGLVFAKQAAMNVAGKGVGAIGGLFGLGKGGGSATKTVSGGATSVAGRGAGAARGGGMMKGGLGVGAAAVGIGAGVGAAAVGISKLADSMSKLSPEQAETLETIATTLAIAFPAAAVGIGILAAVAAPAAVPLLALGGAIFAIGAGVGVAAAGIGYMAEGMSNLDKVDLSGAGAGMMQIGAAGMMMGNPLSILGLGAMTASVSAIGSSAGGLERVGTAFANIGAVLQGNASQFKEVRDTIQAIASTEVGSNSAIANLTNMLSKPLVVEFAEKEVGFVANIDLSMGDNKFITEISKKIPARIVDLSQAKA